MYPKGFDIKTRINKLIASAKARGIHVNLCGNKYQELIDRGCFYCGTSLENEKGYCLDRFDNSKGYIITNVVACCKICNYAKRDMNVGEFARWVDRVYFSLKKRLEDVPNTTFLSHEETMKLQYEVVKDKPKLRIKYVPE